MKNYYNILEVSENASKEVIEKAHKVLVMRYHPDLQNNNLNAENKIREINEAYSVLSDPFLKEQYDSGCLMVRASDTIWAKVCFEYFEEQPSILSVVTRGYSDDCVSAPVHVTKPYLRIARTGHSFAFHYSQDGEKWKLVRYFRMECPEEVQVGVVAQSPIGEGTRVTFGNVRLQQGLEGSILQVE